MLGKYLLNKYDKLATTHLLWTPWGFYCNVTKSSDSKGLREFLSLSACLDSCHFQWPTARTITLCVCYFFPSPPSQECRTEITTARKTAASLSISGKSKEFLKAASNFMTWLRRYIFCCACWDLPVRSQGRPSLFSFKLISLKICTWKHWKHFFFLLLYAYEY